MSSSQIRSFLGQRVSTTRSHTRARSLLGTMSYRPRCTVSKPDLSKITDSKPLNFKERLLAKLRETLPSQQPALEMLAQKLESIKSMEENYHRMIDDIKGHPEPKVFKPVEGDVKNESLQPKGLEAISEDIDSLPSVKNVYKTRVLLQTPIRLIANEPINPQILGISDEANVELNEDAHLDEAYLRNQIKDSVVAQSILTPEQTNAQIGRFRQAILDAHDAAGLEYEEELADDEFPLGPLTLKGSFGTPDQPMLIPSTEDKRIVGCQGGAGPRHHEVMWHTVKKSKPLCCMECGQIFRLVDHLEWIQWAAYEWEVNGQDTVQFFLPEHD